MPVFFFHLRTTHGREDDDVGTDFPDLEAAYLDVCRAIPEMVPELHQDGCDPLRCAFEIVGREGQHLMHVPFSEILTKGCDLSGPRFTRQGEMTHGLIEGLCGLAKENLAQVRRLRDQLQRAHAVVAQMTGQQHDRSFLDRIAASYGIDNDGDGTEPIV